ncbi:MAG: 2-dehydropantoate 2-reductase [Ketobacteraceae bacterium]|nr:2-dehydropantoate 2-reductase [Ketobacteraceae bacterium]
MSSWTILGAGAIGGLFACQLARAGIPVRLSTSRRPASGHYRLTLLEGRQATPFHFPVLTPDQGIDQLIIATKTYQTPAAIGQIRQQIRPGGSIIVMQNGMGTSEWLRSEIPDARVRAASTTHGAYRESDGQIVHAGKGDTWLGPLQERDIPLARAICDQWQGAGVPVRWDASIHQRLWLKLGINCAINPLTVIYQCRNGELLEKPEALGRMEGICSEFTQTFQAVMGGLPGEDVFQTAKTVAEKTAANISSMRQDVLKGNPTEIDAINGYLITQARARGIPCPVNEATVAELKRVTGRQPD